MKTNNYIKRTYGSEFTSKLRKIKHGNI